MKKFLIPIVLSGAICIVSCSQDASQNSGSNSDMSVAQDGVGQSNVKDETSQPNIVQTAIGSKDHTTLVAAVKQAGLVDALSNTGPFTVFAPTNAAFDKLPKGTVDDLMKPENKGKLNDILGYHTYVGVLRPNIMMDGATFEMVTPAKISVTKNGDKTLINGSEILASIETSNGVIHVIGDVLLPPEKK